MTRTYRSIARARERDTRIRRVAYWARKAHVVKANRAEREMVRAESELNDALEALRPGDIRALRS